MSSNEGCKKVEWIIGGTILLLIGFLVFLAYNLVYLQKTLPDEISIWAAIIILAIIFLLLIYIGCSVDGTLDQGEMRRAIAGTFVLGFTILIFFLSTHKIENEDIITAYLQMVGVIIGFYFGAKTALMGTSTGTSEGLAIENMVPDTLNKKIVLTIRNKGDSKLVVDKVYVKGAGLDKDFDKDIQIDSKTSTKIDVGIDPLPTSGSVINIKVVANTGLADEREYTWPKQA